MATRSRRKKNNNLQRSGFLLMFFVLVILGSVIYFYRDRFFVLFDTGVSSGKKMIGVKDSGNDEKKAFELMDFIEGLNGKKSVENNKKETKNTDVLQEKVTVKRLPADDKEKIEQKEIVHKAKEIESKVEKEDNKITKNNEIVEKNVVKSEPVVVKKKVVTKTASVKTAKSENGSVNEPAKKKYVQKNTSTVNKTVKSKTESAKLTKVYFSQFDEAVGIKLISAYRKIDYGNAPLTAVLNSLLKGPSADEVNKNVITNVPIQTVLKSVHVKDGVAYINLSTAFENNPYGKESTIAQLKQIVFTATEFRNISAVQFLIDGKVKNYLGGEGVPIDRPLSRNDFS